MLISYYEGGGGGCVRGGRMRVVGLSVMGVICNGTSERPEVVLRGEGGRGRGVE